MKCDDLKMYMSFQNGTYIQIEMPIEINMVGEGDNLFIKTAMNTEITERIFHALSNEFFEDEILDYGFIK